MAGTGVGMSWDKKVRATHLQLGNMANVGTNAYIGAMRKGIEWYGR